MSDVPEDILKAAEKTLDTLLCNCREAGDVRQDSILDIAQALLAERLAQKERDAKLAIGFDDGDPQSGFSQAAGTIARLIRRQS